MPTLKDLQERYGAIRQRIVELREVADEKRDAKWTENFERACGDAEKLKTAAEAETRADELVKFDPTDKHQKRDISQARELVYKSWKAEDLAEKHDKLERALTICLRAKLGARLGNIITPEDLAEARSMGFEPSAHELAVPMATNQELRAMKTTTAGAGLEWLPISFVPQLELELKALSPVRTIAGVRRTDSGEDLRWPIGTATSKEAQWVGESIDWVAAAGVVSDPTTAYVNFKAWKSVSGTRLSYEQLQDTGFDLGAELASMLGEAQGRAHNKAFTIGTGASQPAGYITDADANVNAEYTNGAAGNPVPDDVINLMHKLDPAYRRAGAFFSMNDAIVAIVRKLKEVASGAYIWQPSFQLGQPDRILGWPLFVNQHMLTSVAAGANIMAFGFMPSYKIRDVGEVRLRVLTERYAEYDDIMIVSLMRTDGHTLTATTWTRPPICIMKGA